MKLTFNDKVAQERTQSNSVSKQRNVKVALDRDFATNFPIWWQDLGQHSRRSFWLFVEHNMLTLLWAKAWAFTSPALYFFSPTNHRNNLVTVCFCAWVKLVGKELMIDGQYLIGLISCSSNIFVCYAWFFYNCCSYDKWSMFLN